MTERIFQFVFKRESRAVVAAGDLKVLLGCGGCRKEIDQLEKITK